MDKEKKMLKEDEVIDYFYKESIGADLEDAQQYMKKLKQMSRKMSVLDTEVQLDINIMDIIMKAESIKNKRKAGVELLLFAAAAMLILTVFAAAAITIGPRFLIGFQAAATAILPLALLPISGAILKGGARNG